MRVLAFVALTLALAGCGIVGEERSYYMKKDWDRIKGSVWGESSENLGWEKAFGTARAQERQNENSICLHANSRNRVTVQDGVEDQYAYRRCALAPYDTAGGTRMGIRPDGNGTVVKN